MGTPFWLDNPGAWDHPIFSFADPSVGKIVLPGTSTVKVNRKRHIDVKKTPGRTGATLTNLGADPAEVTITCTLWTRDHLKVIDRLFAALSSAPGKNKAEPFTLSHPKAKMYGIAKVLLSDISGPDDSGLKSAMQVVFKLVEYRPAVADQGTFGAKKAPSLEDLAPKSAGTFAWAQPTADTAPGARDWFEASQQNANQQTNPAWLMNAPSKTGIGP